MPDVRVWLDHWRAAGPIAATQGEKAMPNLTAFVTALVSVLAMTAAGFAPVAAADDARLNRFIDRLDANEVAIGVFASDRSPDVAASLGGSALDFTIIDLEHAPADFERLQGFILAMRTRAGFETTPIVRIPTNGREAHMNQWMFKQALDAGAFGVMAPHVNTAEQARNVVVAMRYPQAASSPVREPRGQRGWAPFGAVAAWGVELGDYAERADLWPLASTGEIVFIAQIETARAVDNLAGILATPGVGGAFVGPADLHADMGYLGQSGVAVVEERIAQAGQIASAMGAKIGITARPDEIEARRAQGFSFFTVGANVLPRDEVDAALAAAGR